MSSRNWDIREVLTRAKSVCRARSIRRLKYREVIADNLSKAGWSRGCVATVDSRERTIFVTDAHRDDGKRFVVRADEKSTAFVKLRICGSSRCELS